MALDSYWYVKVHLRSILSNLTDEKEFDIVFDGFAKQKISNSGATMENEKSPPPYAANPVQGPMNPPYPTGHQGFPQPQQHYPGQPGGGYPAPAQPGYNPPQPGYYPPQQPQQPVFYQPQPVHPITTQQQTTVVMAGGGGQMPGQCPVCRAGMLNREFTCCGICCAICFFPLGLICLFTMKETRCSVCRANF